MALPEQPGPGYNARVDEFRADEFPMLKGKSPYTHLPIRGVIS